jgi:NAD(P)-dependent dehydrogenase (short-subunit alcohol dehydrogenase family)
VNWLENKVCIVAGGLGLIGKAFVEAILENGGIAIIGDLNNANGTDFVDVLAERFDPNRIELLNLDIISKVSINQLIETVYNKYGKIDAFVNTSYPRNKNWGNKFEDVTYEDFCENVNLHLGGYFLASQQMATFFKTQNYGCIINISSIQGVNAPKFDTYEGIVTTSGKEMTSPVEYSAIKAGIVMLTKYMAKYFKGTNVRFNCISPGGILADQPTEFLDRYQKYCTSKGMLDPVDLKGALIFLLSDFSKYVNGQNIIVDDGWTL